MAQIIVNDEKQDVTLPLTLSELIKLNKVFQPEMVTVQVNENYSYDIVIRAVEKGQDDASLPISSY